MNDGRTVSQLLPAALWRFLPAALAVWRLSLLLAEERGPWETIARIRARLAAHPLGRVLDCFYCVSVWIALPMAILLSDGWLGLAIRWPALVAAAGLFHRATAMPRRTAPLFRELRVETILEAVEDEPEREARYV